MGLFSAIGKLLGGDSSKDIRRGEERALAQQERALEYQKGIDAPVIDYRNQALDRLSDYHMGGQEGQQQFFDQVLASPAYQNYMQQSEESILRNKAATGELRGGSVAPALALNQTNVAQGLVSQRLQGLRGFTNPGLNTSNIASTYGNMGNIQQQAAIAQGQNKQNLAGLGMGALTGAFSAGMSGGMFSGMFGGGAPAAALSTGGMSPITHSQWSPLG